VTIPSAPNPSADPRVTGRVGTPVSYAPVGAIPMEAYRPTPWLNLIVLMVLLITPMIVLSQVIAYWRTDVVDDQMFGYFGWRIAHGARVYIDVWDNKPPGIYWINALGMLLARDHYGGIMALCVLALVIAHTCFFAIGASLYFRGAATLATILLSFFLTHAFYTGGTNRTETFVVACELSAVLLYVRGFARDRWWKWYAAGLCCGVAFLFKQVGLAAWAALGVHTVVLMCTRELALRDGLRRGVLLLAGTGTVVAAAAGYLAAQGALYEAWFAAFVFNRAYFATGTSAFPYSFVSWVLLRNHFFPILLLPLLMAIAGCVHAALWTLRPRFRPPEIEAPLQALAPACPRPMILFATWYAISFWAALLSPHAFRHYLVPTIPPLMLMAAYLVSVLQAEMRLLVRMQQRAWVTAAIVLIAYFSIDAVRRQWEEVSRVWVYRFIQHERPEWEVIGDAVTDITSPDDKIHCWGYYPGVYLYAHRINTGRFITTEKVGQVGAQANFVMHELEQKLKTDPPVVLAMSASDYEWLHGRATNRPPPAVLLGPWVDEHYARVADIPRINAYVFKRHDRVQPSDFDVLSRISLRG